MATDSQTRFLLINATAMGGLALTALFLGRWPLAFVAMATFGLSLVPMLVANRFSVSLPSAYLAATTLFVFASVFLGEAFDFYERLWWWDLALHGSSAVGFGLLGFLFVFMLFDGDRFAAPPAALGFIAFCLAVTVGTLWEVFEFLMDLWFGLNMQKSGLVDTMTDLMIDVLGASIAGFTGYLYLIGREGAGLAPLIARFVAMNRRLYRKARDRRKG